MPSRLFEYRWASLALKEGASTKKTGQADPWLLLVNLVLASSCGFNVILMRDHINDVRRYRCRLWCLILCSVPTIASVERPILGADFPKSSGLLVDVRKKHLIHPQTQDPSSQSITKAPTLKAGASPQVNHISQLPKKFPAITNPDFSNKNTKHEIKLTIPTTGPPFLSWYPQLRPGKSTGVTTTGSTSSAPGQGLVRLPLCPKTTIRHSHWDCG